MDIAENYIAYNAYSSLSVSEVHLATGSSPFLMMCGKGKEKTVATAMSMRWCV